MRLITRSSRQGSTDRKRASPSASGGGRTRWAHFEFTRINIELTIQKNQVEDLMNVRGVGEKSFLRLKPLITVTPPKTDRAAQQ